MNVSSQFETLSRVAACLGLELRLDRDINKGFFLRDLRDPEEVVECSDDEPASLEDAANTLIELLQQGPGQNRQHEAQDQPPRRALCHCLVIHIVSLPDHCPFSENITKFMVIVNG